MSSAAKVTRLADYKPYEFEIKTTELSFDIQEGQTTVDSRLQIERVNPDATDIFLDGTDLDLLRVCVNGRELSGNEYQVNEEGMTIFGVESEFSLQVSTKIVPESNKRLMGLYKSRHTYCTQCEAEGFRRMTFYPDRPDVQSVFTTHIEADGSKYPVLLSNGNPLQEVELGNGRVRSTWHDPFRKPSYLFAMVAGDLQHIEDRFTTQSGRDVALRIYSESDAMMQCRHAMNVLKTAMRWDEERYGREYDLDIFMIVAVPDFNFGAMENKGLNIFNTTALLASPDTATDAAYDRVLRVVAHEYFHNWSGNRVTCREWFQLSLKEGFTVFRDSQFSGDMSSRAVKRVEDVQTLRLLQFPEDAGPLAHPVRPEQYSAINNFYSPTVYNKGAEVVRMMHTSLGERKFRRGTDQYFETFDGSAATTEDFVRCMEDASGADLQQFRRWYTQSGTPELTVQESRFNGHVDLQIKQTCPPTPGQPIKKPFHVPVALGIVDSHGREVLGVEGRANGYRVELETAIAHDNPNRDGTVVLNVTQPVSHVRFKDVPADAAISFLRGFSAPVNVTYERTAETLTHLAVQDTDGFARCDAARTLFDLALADDEADTSTVLDLAATLVDQAKQAPDDGETKALICAALHVPSPLETLRLRKGTDIFAIRDRTNTLMRAMASRLRDDWRELAEANSPSGAYVHTKEASARRTLRATAMKFLRIGTPTSEVGELRDWLVRCLREADNLTDRSMALQQLIELEGIDDKGRRSLLEDLYREWKREELVLLQWFRLQGACTRPGGLQRVERLRNHEGFKAENPNFARALYGGLILQDVSAYHDPSGAGYRYVADRTLDYDTENGHIASLLMTEMSKWNDFDSRRQELIVGELRRVRSLATSKEVIDKVDRSLENAPDAWG